MRPLFAILFTLCLLAACSTYGTRPEKVVPGPRWSRPPRFQPHYAPGSLWPGENARNSSSPDNKARYVNDIVTIVVNESSSGQTPPAPIPAGTARPAPGSAPFWGWTPPLPNRTPTWAAPSPSAAPPPNP